MMGTLRIHLNSEVQINQLPRPLRKCFQDVCTVSMLQRTVLHWNSPELSELPVAVHCVYCEADFAAWLSLISVLLVAVPPL